MSSSNKIKRILVCVGEATRLSRQTLRKVAVLASNARARIELFHAVRDPEVRTQRIGVGPRREAKAAAGAAHARELQRLEKIARSPELQSLSVSCTVAVDYPPYEAVVRRAIATRADLVVVSFHEHPLGARLALRYTDWELVRHCPVPLLLLKSTRSYDKAPVMVAVDPFHAHAKPARLDERLLQWGTELSRTLRGPLHVFHSYLPLVEFLPSPVGVNVPVGLPPELEASHAAQVARGLSRLAERYRIPEARRHLHMGITQDELNATAEGTKTAIVVMGALSRSGLKRLLIGNTAERALGLLRTDVLIVKPRTFHSGVPLRPA